MCVQYQYINGDEGTRMSIMGPMKFSRWNEHAEKTKKLQIWYLLDCVNFCLQGSDMHPCIAQIQSRMFFLCIS